MKEIKHVLFIVENNTVPKDVRVWRQAVAIKEWGYEVSVICRKEGPYKNSKENIDGIDIYRHYMPPDISNKLSFFLEYLIATILEFTLAFRLYIKKPFHIIHAANPPDLIFLIGAFYKLFSVKYIFDVHDLSPELYNSLYIKKSALILKALLLAEKLSCKLADVIITTNQSYRDVIRERNKIEQSRIFVVRNDPKIEDFMFFENQKIQQVEKKQIILFVGAINQQDGVLELLKALHYLIYVLNEKDIRCVIIGGGRALTEVEKTIMKLNLENYVIIKGPIYNRKIIYDFLNSADVCVEPAPFNEINNVSTFIKILEYMASAKPIVAFDLRESRYSANGSAVFIQPNDTEGFAKGIKKLLNDSKLRKKMGLVGRERIRNELNWDNSLEHLKSAYITLCN
jgi:glycosyltransferase involved in cell wall biosynthesis